ncbi:MAG: SDR family NAD(P)-dependent oxidoreductase [Steroidobacteraceae bacterium]
MQINGCCALVTGANRGIGLGFVAALLERGARKVYATARRTESLTPVTVLDRERIVPMALDVVDAEAIAAACAAASDVNLLVNNAGIVERGGFLDRPDLDGPRHEMEVNFWAQLAMIRAFAPQLADGGIIQVLSIGAVATVPYVGSYCASKFAARAMTQCVRAELAAQRTQVMAIYPGAIATDMSAQTPGPKISPHTHAHHCLAAFEAGVDEFFPDFKAQAMRDQLLRNQQPL